MEAVESALRPLLRPITHNLPLPVLEAATRLLGEQCTTSLVQNINLADIPCLKLAISKALGLSIIAASSIVKVPQILKLLNSQSAAGLSFTSYLLETISYLITLAYNLRSGHPFSTYGEVALIAVQNMAIAVLILQYSRKQGFAAAFVGGIAAASYALLNEGIVDWEMMKYLQAGAGVLGVAAKVPQILTIAREGGTGQVSAFAVFNYLAGSLTRIFTTLQEVDDKLILYGFVAGFVLNAILAAQMMYYWNSKSVGPSVRQGTGLPKSGKNVGRSTTRRKA
ncbi:mannose-P-dolichol utilization defect 1 protein [Piedraia hortae CBS 480.64]|uniref:Mannose-P-dolichol utilization defect 1 protein homolog n=1 Tax=Piedraia hortae CBS 480.64 TaxID=1314780 RepID=A0A6A7BR55_9PEZI|nr:mannose-P-dolichol utilization defect 1 protein [Piedraia hortae CBS 480.64]